MHAHSITAALKKARAAVAAKRQTALDAYGEEDLMEGDAYHAKDSAFRVIQFIIRGVEVEEDQADGTTSVFTRNEAIVRCLGPAMAQGLLDPDLGGFAQPPGGEKGDNDDRERCLERVCCDEREREAAR